MPSTIAQLTCDCGAEIDGHQGNAGSNVDCRCGKSVAVPKLSELRKLAGKSAYATNPADMVRELASNGTNPGSANCLECGASGGDLYRCEVVCEQSYANKAPANEGYGFIHRTASVLMLLFLPFSIWFSKRQNADQKEAEIRGHDISVTFPIRVCRPCTLVGCDPTKQRSLRQLLEKASEYRAVLDYYPNAVPTAALSNTSSATKK
jgi:hypothetical protein